MKLSLGIFLLLLANSAFSQSVNIGFNSTHSGRNVTAVYEKQVKQHEFSFGIGYNINRYIEPDNQYNFYKKRLFATNTVGHINLNFTYQRYVFSNLTCIKPFVFYDLQAKYSSTRNQFPYIVTIAPDGGLIYTEHTVAFGPFTWLENNIGIGFTADITDKFYLKQKFGAGMVFILGEQQVPGQNFNWEFSTLLSFSVGMRL